MSSRPSEQQAPTSAATPPKFLRLSHAMHPNSIILKIQLARRDQAIDSLTCKGLNLNCLRQGEDDTVGDNSQPSITRHLKDLIYSRKWARIEFESCRGAERLLVEGDDLQQSTTTPTIDFLSIRFSRDGPPPGTRATQKYDNNLFQRLWKSWKIQKCRLSLDFCNLRRLEDFIHPQSSSELIELDLTGSTWLYPGIGENGSNNNWKTFCQSLVKNHRHLQRLEIRMGNQSDPMVAALIDNTVSQHPTLEQVHIPGNDCQREALCAWSKALRCHTDQPLPLSKRLKALTISNDRLSEDVVPGLQEFCSSLHHAQSLVTLKLGDYMIHEQDMVALVGSLSKMRCIESLSLLSCGLTAASIRYLCHDGLKQNKIPSLRAISLPEDAKEAMLDALADNTSIERLLMEGGLGDHKYLMDLNRGGRRLLAHSPSIPNALWPTILSRAMHYRGLNFYYGGHKRHLDVLYCLLRNKIVLEMD